MLGLYANAGNAIGAGLEPLFAAPVGDDFAVRFTQTGYYAGDTVGLFIENGPVVGGLTTSAGVLEIVTQSDSFITFKVPEPSSFGDKTLNYYEPIEVTVSDGAFNDTFNLVIEAKPNELHGLITSVYAGGVYDGDGVAVGTDYGHFKNISSGVSIDPSDGSFVVSTDSTAEYAIYDGAWSNYFLLNFEAPEVLVNVDASTETSTASPMTPAIDSDDEVNVGGSSETGSASAVNPVVDGSPINVPVGDATETGSASNVVPLFDADNEQGVSPSTEVSLAEGVTPQLEDGDIQQGVGISEETSVAAPIVPPLNVSVGPSGEQSEAGEVVALEIAFMPRAEIYFTVPNKPIYFEVPN